MELGRVFLVAAGLLVATTAFLVWRFRWKRATKDWCVMLYFVARDNDPADFYLDPKLDQVLGDLWALPCAHADQEQAEPNWDNVHVVYRAIWDDSSRTPEAKVVHWRWLSRPSTSFFPSQPAPIPGNLTQDLHGFFQWAYDNCPATRYAVFFWGHSFGPGGLFTTNQPPIVDPPPGTPVFWSRIDQFAVQSGTQKILNWRLRDAERMMSRSVASFPAPGGGTTGAGGTGGGSTPTSTPKVEIVLFQDCWMATLETAFTLEDSVRYIVASQSLVPIGLDSNGQVVPTATWPYKKIIDALLGRVDYAVGALEELKTYYNLSPSNRYPNTTVPFSLLDLGAGQGEVSAKLTSPLQHLVASLSSLGTVKRRQLIQDPGPNAGRLLFIDAQGVLRAGDVALLDVLTLCRHLESQTLVGTTSEQTAISTAAANLRLALTGSSSPWAVVGPTFEAADPANVLGFTGVSVLYKPSRYMFPSGDTTMLQGVQHDYYILLPFAQATLQGTDCWTIYAFEQLGFSVTC